jgi:hypothetical protein
VRSEREFLDRKLLDLVDDFGQSADQVTHLFDCQAIERVNRRVERYRRTIERHRDNERLSRDDDRKVDAVEDWFACSGCHCSETPM